MSPVRFCSQAPELVEQAGRPGALAQDAGALRRQQYESSGSQLLRGTWQQCRKCHVQADVDRLSSPLLSGSRD